MFKVNLKVKLNHPNAKLPEYKKPGDSGMDVSSIEDYVLKPGEVKGISTGLSFEIPEFFEIQVRPRSGLALKHGITILNSPGTVDSSFTGEIVCILINHSNKDFKISIGDRIAQIVLCSVDKANLTITEEELHKTERGDSGFGSTGIK